MRLPGILGAVTLSLLGAQEAVAQRIDVRWEVLAPDEKAIIDRIAADFFESSLRKSQSYAIEEKTSRSYAIADPETRARFREARRLEWDEMNEAERESLRNVETPSFNNLTEEQKSPFRTIALDKLEAEGAIDGDALTVALSRDI